MSQVSPEMPTAAPQGARHEDMGGAETMMDRCTPMSILIALDAETRALVRLAAVLAGGGEAQVRVFLAEVHHAAINPVWVEEVILQTYLFAGFPRALNAAREWRRISGRAAPEELDETSTDVECFARRGEVTCATVYGRFYERLRVNIRELHPALDQWMIVEGYGKVLGRPNLDLARRELCVIAACAIARQDRQLHSHLHGALHAGASAAVVTDALGAIEELLLNDDVQRYARLWSRVQGK